MSKTTFDLSTLDLAVGSHTVKVKAKADGYADSDFSNELTVNVYSITSTLTNCTTDNTTAKYLSGVAYSATVTAADGYTFDGGTYALTVGGVDITSTGMVLNDDKTKFTVLVTSAQAIGDIVYVANAVEEISAATASTTATSGVSYTDGLSGIDAETVAIFAQAISNNSAITSSTADVYIDYGDVHRKVSVANQVTLPLNGTDYAFDVIGFNHDDLTTLTAYGEATATGKAGITFQMHDLFATTYPMNSSNTNTGGWKSSVMRTSTMATMKGYLPTAWQTAIKAVNKKSGTGGSSSSETETVSDSCFLLAEIEIFGETAYSVSGEGMQYKYYSAGNPAIKYKTGYMYYWWERSPYSGGIYWFCKVSGDINTDSGGDADISYAGVSGGVAFGFCV